AEMFLGPQGHTARGVSLATILEGVFSAMEEARLDVGISSGLLLVAQRHRSQEEALQMLDDAMPWADRILGFGLGGAEVGNPPSKFSELFRRCRERGFRVVAHAGEEGPAAYVREADRKSTRLNSSHVKISYAVFCLKTKKNIETPYDANDIEERIKTLYKNRQGLKGSDRTKHARVDQPAEEIMTICIEDSNET